MKGKNKYEEEINLREMGPGGNRQKPSSLCMHSMCASV